MNSSSLKCLVKWPSGKGSGFGSGGLGAGSGCFGVDLNSNESIESRVFILGIPQGFDVGVLSKRRFWQ